MPIEISSTDTLLARFGPGQRLFLPGSSGEPRPLVEALSRAAQELPGLEVTHNFLPGINTVPLAAGENRLREVALFPRAASTAQDAIRVLPLTYYAARQYLAAQDFDWVALQVSPPGPDGQCSLGPSVEFAPAALTRGRQVIGIINHSIPSVAGAQAVPLSRFDLTMEVDWPLVTYDPGAADEESRAIARWLGTLVEDNAVLQVGMGRVPASLLEQLSGARNLRLHSGLLSQGFRTLAEAGALAEGQAHVGCTSLGDADFYRWLGQCRDLRICDVDYSHDPAVLAGLQNLIAINSAMEVDLLGQANLETLGGKAVSGIGGAPDFCRGARYSPGGKSIIALPATARGGQVSRIVHAFPPGQPVSLGRQDIDYVVTEFGIATLTNKSPMEKARELIDIAAPRFREQLEKAL